MVWLPGCAGPGGGAGPHAIGAPGGFSVFGTVPRDAPIAGGRALYGYGTDDLCSWSEFGPLITQDDVLWIEEDGADRITTFQPRR